MACVHELHEKITWRASWEDERPIMVCNKGNKHGMLSPQFGIFEVAEAFYQLGKHTPIFIPDKGLDKSIHDFLMLNELGYSLLELVDIFINRYSIFRWFILWRSLRRLEAKGFIESKGIGLRKYYRKR